MSEPAFGVLCLSTLLSKLISVIYKILCIQTKGKFVIKLTLVVLHEKALDSSFSNDLPLIASKNIQAQFISHVLL